MDSREHGNAGVATSVLGSTSASSWVKKYKAVFFKKALLNVELTTLKKTVSGNVKNRLHLSAG